MAKITLDNQFAKYVGIFNSQVTELIETNELNLEQFRLCLQDLFLSMTEKKASMLRHADEDEQEKQRIEIFCEMAVNMFKAVSGDNFYQLCVNFGDLHSKYIADRPEFLNALHSENLSEIAQTLSTIFDASSEPMQRVLELEESNLKGRILADLDEGPILRSDSINLLVYLTNIRRTALGKAPFDCKIVNITSLDNYLKKNINISDSNRRFQVMVFNTSHYTAVECRIIDGKKQAIVMDAAQDERYKEICLILEKQGYQVVVIGEPNRNERIQFDGLNCSFFSYDNLLNSSRTKNFFDLVLDSPSETINGRIYVPWKEMPACILRNAQSNTFLNGAYADKPTLPGESLPSDESDEEDKQTILKRYTDIYSEFSKPSADGSTPAKAKQVGIQNFRQRQKGLARVALELLTENDLIDILKRPEGLHSETAAKLVDFQNHFFKQRDILEELTGRFSSSKSEIDSKRNKADILGIIEAQSRLLRKTSTIVSQFEKELDVIKERVIQPEDSSAHLSFNEALEFWRAQEKLNSASQFTASPKPYLPGNEHKTVVSRGSLKELSKAQKTEDSEGDGDGKSNGDHTGTRL